MPHNPLTRDFLRKLNSLQRLAALVEGTLEKEASELDARLTNDAKGLTEGARHDLFEYHAEDYFELSDEFATLLRYSILTGADSALEAYLNNTCASYAEIEATAVKLSDFRGAGIERARDYLKKVAGIVFPDVSVEWTTVKRLHDVRNAILHAEGYVPPEKTDLRMWSVSVPGITITAGGVISLEREFTSTAVGAYEAFARSFDEACQSLGLWRTVFPVEES